MVKPDIRDYGYYKIQLEVNNTCNMRCSFCPSSISKLPKRHMDKEHVFKILDSLSQYEGVGYVTFPQFGEPLLNENIWDYIDRCRNLNLKSQLVTNGALLTDENINRLYQHSPDSLQISLQILDPESYLKVRNAELPFSVYIERIATALARFIDHKPQITEIHTDLAFQWDNYLGLIGIRRRILQKLGISELGDPTMSSPTIRELKPSLIQFLQMIEKRARNFKLSMAAVDANIKAYYSKPSSLMRFTAYDFGDNHKIYYKPFFNGHKRTRYYPVKNGVCCIPILGILADGRVSICLQDYDGFATIGSILEEDLVSILKRNKKMIYDFRNYGKIPFAVCRRCLGAPTRFGAMMKNYNRKIVTLLRKTHTP